MEEDEYQEELWMYVASGPADAGSNALARCTARLTGFGSATLLSSKADSIS